MPINELGPGQQTLVPGTPLRVRATSSTRTPVLLEIQGDPAASQRLSRIESVILPAAVGAVVQVSVRPEVSTAFPDEAVVGLSMTTGSDSDRHQVLVTECGLAGMASAQLARVEIQPAGLAVCAIGLQQAPRWFQAGVAAAATNDPARSSWARTTSWALLVDGSASMLSLQAEGQLKEVLATVCGARFQSSGSLPTRCLTTTGDGCRDVRSLVCAEDLDVAAFGDQAPAPWGVLAPGLRELIGDAESIIVVTDGIPPDVVEIIDLISSAPIECVVVTVGQAHRAADGVALQADLAQLEPLRCLPNVEVAAIPRTAVADGPIIDLSEPIRLALASVVATPAKATDGDGSRS